ncbi:hypothetical protein SAMN06265222_10549 [Neorhodopirellula lusitana]|uniref:Uncharacterized protein n=1 Tax=Neorhodopirellula lusitana TaxID=445327 RepID=A0ABY1Q1J5_9BACT|nr:hypothetical protein SAMN06265222_10549 [Neorhodopirellula lusitana]
MRSAGGGRDTGLQDRELKKFNWKMRTANCVAGRRIARIFHFPIVNLTFSILIAVPESFHPRTIVSAD